MIMHNTDASIVIDMGAEEYLQRCAAICADFEPENCSDCPLRPLGCGMPKEPTQHMEVMHIAAQYKAPPPLYACPGCDNMDHLTAAKFCMKCGLEIKEGDICKKS